MLESKTLAASVGLLKTRRNDSPIWFASAKLGDVMLIRRVTEEPITSIVTLLGSTLKTLATFCRTAMRAGELGG